MTDHTAAMRILVSNDDGVYSPGIKVLSEVASEFGEVRVVAPDVERSSAAHSITANGPLTYKRTALGVEAYRVNGTPADCVLLGLAQWKDVDVVLSGINFGSNLGNSIWHSGTVAAAKQAALLGCRGIAVSVPAPTDEPDFEPFKPAVREVLECLLPKRELRLVNVNLPPERPKGIQWTRQSVRLYDGKVVAAKDPMGRAHFWFAVDPITDTEPGTDRYAVEHGYVAITPLRLDLTDEQALAAQARLSGDGTQLATNA